MKKYEFTGNEKIVSNGTRQFRLHEIRALKEIKRHGVSVGDKGGWIESPQSLEQNGDCWVGEGSYIYDNSEVVGDALVLLSRIAGGAHIGGEAKVIRSQLTGNNSSIANEAVLRDMIVHGTLHAHKNAIFENTVIFQYVKAMEPDIVVRTSSFVGDNRLAQGAHIEHSSIANAQFRYGSHRLKASTLESESLFDVKGDIDFENTFIVAEDMKLVTPKKIVSKDVYAVELEKVDIDGVLYLQGVYVEKGTSLNLEDGTLNGSYYPNEENEKRYGIQLSGENVHLVNSQLRGDILLSGDWYITRSELNGIISMESDSKTRTLLMGSTITELVSVSIPKNMNGVVMQDLTLQGDSQYDSAESLEAIDVKIRS